MNTIYIEAPETTYDKLLKGEIPDAYKERYNIVDPQNPLAQKYEAYAAQIARRLIGKDYDPEKHNMRFLLSADNAPQAFIQSGLNPPIICFSKGIINLFETEDEFAAIMAHEFSHERFREKFGNNNSKVEEMTADIYGVWLLKEANYRPRAMAEVLSKLIDNKAATKKLEAFDDIHPNTPDRVRAAENAVDLGGLFLGQVEKKDPTPFDQQLWKEIEAYTQPSFIDTVLNEKGFNEVAPARKIEIIHEVFKEQATYGADKPEEILANCWMSRIKDLTNALNSTRYEFDDATYLQPLTALVDDITEEKDAQKIWPQSFNETYRERWRTSSQLIGLTALNMNSTLNKYHPSGTDNRMGWEIGKLGEFLNAVSDFVDATDPDTARKSADQFITTRNDFNLTIVSNIAQYIPEFNVPTKDKIAKLSRENDKKPLQEQQEIIIPWAQHIKWAHEDVANNSKPSIQLGLTLLDVDKTWGTPKISENQPPYEFTTKLGKEIKYTWLSPEPMFKSVSYERLDPDTIEFSDQGHVLGFKKPDRYWLSPNSTQGLTPLQRDELIMSHEQKWLDHKNAQGLKAAETADWSVWNDIGWTKTFDKILSEKGAKEGSVEMIAALAEHEWFRTHDAFRRYRYKDFDDVVRITDDKYTAAMLKREAIAEAEIDERNTRMESFMDRYQDHIVAQRSIFEGADGFAKQFTQHLKKCAETEPETYQKIIHHVMCSNTSLRTGELCFSTSIVRLINRQGRDRETGIDLDSVKCGNKPFCVSINHPYMDLITDEKSGFDPYERAEFVSFTRYMDEDPNKSVEQKWNIDYNKVLGLKPCEKVADAKNLRSLAGYQGSFGSTNRHSLFIASIMGTELLRVIKNNTQDFDRDEVLALHAYSLVASPTVMFKELRQGSQKAFEDYAQKEMTKEDQTAFGLIDSYTQFTRYGLFMDNPKIARRYEGQIIEKIKDIKDPETKQQALEHLLFSRELHLKEFMHADYSTYICVLTDPDFRSFVVDQYATTCTQLYGKDNGSPAFHSSAEKLIADINKNTEGTLSFDILAKLADQMDMRQDLSYSIRDIYKKFDIQKLTTTTANSLFAIGEISIDDVCTNESFRLDTIKFISDPISSSSINTYLQQIEDRSFDYKIISSKQNNIKEKLSDTPRDSSSHSSSDPFVDAKRETLIQGYKNFWALPMAARTIIFEKILFPVRNSNALDKNSKSFLQNKNYVLDTFLPVPQEKQTGLIGNLKNKLIKQPLPNNNVIARDFAECYLRNSEESEQRLMLSAFFVAQNPMTKEKNQADHTSGIDGKALKLLLCSRGPAGVKIAQAIAGHPATPEKIRKELEETKFNADRPYRWSVFEALEKNKISDQFDHIGPILGAGSYGITIETHRKDGRETATTVLRDHVRNTAEREFSIFQKVCQEMVKKYPDFTPLKDMIHQAHHMSKVETDMTLASRQVKFARRLYDVSVEVDGKNFAFKSAPWVANGPDYKETGTIAGAHFIDLPSDTPQQAAEKRAIAKAVLAVEQRVLVSGKPFDHDRHGGQQKIMGADIGNFDHGAMSLKAPDTKQKILLGTVLGKALRKHALSNRKIPVSEALMAEIDQQAKNPKHSIFMTEVRRAFLAQNDFITYLKEEAGPIIAATWSSPDVHPLIRKGMNKGMGLTAPFIMKQLRKTGEQANLTIGKGPGLDGDFQTTHIRHKTVKEKTQTAPQKEPALQQPTITKKARNYHALKQEKDSQKSPPKMTPTTRHPILGL